MLSRAASLLIGILYFVLVILLKVISQVTGCLPHCGFSLIEDDIRYYCHCYRY